MFSKEYRNSRPFPSDKKPPGLLSRFFFCWIIRLFYNGYNRTLDENDLVPPKDSFKAKSLGDLLERNWIKEETAAKASGEIPCLLKAIVKTFIWTYLPAGILIFGYNFFRTSTPLLFGQMLRYWSLSSPVSQTTAIYYALGMIFGNLAGSFFYNHGYYYSLQCALKIKIAILRMNNISLGQARAGKIVNLLSNDLQRFDITLQYLHYTWILPLQLAAVCWIGYQQAGYAVLIGLVASVLIFLPMQAIFGGIIGKIRGNAAKRTDERIQLMNEVISGIKVIKQYAWELPFQKLVEEKRDEEMADLQKAIYIKSSVLGLMSFAERAGLFVTILALVLLGHPMTAGFIFPLQQFLNAAQMSLTFYLPFIITSIAEIRVSISRIQDFLLMEDRPDLAPSYPAPGSTLFRHKTTKYDDKKVTSLAYHKTTSLITYCFHRNNTLRRSMSFPNDIAVKVRDVSTSWTGGPNMLALKNVSLELRRGKLCAIIGAVGSGKSTFLQLLLKALPATSGSISVNGTVSYAGQDAWLYSGTVRQNITFGLPYDELKYNKVCKSCALEKDFFKFPYGDQSLVGERGVSLSGGQRARINLARAIYKEADIYLLDDPLSAVDANVGRQLFEACINGYLRGRTRILVTHQTHFLQAADKIVILNEGKVVNVGSFYELSSSSTELLMALQKYIDAGDNELLTKLDEPNHKMKESSSKVAEQSEVFTAQKVKDEERQYGHLSWEVISAVFTFGGAMTVVTLFMVLVVAFCAASSDFWITYWCNQMAIYEKGLNGTAIDTSLDLKVGQFTTAQYLIIHGCIIGVCIALTQIRISTFVRLCVSASKKLHNLMFSSIIIGVVHFFDTNLSGRILNRVTKDIGEIDESVPRSLGLMFQIYGTLWTILVLNAIALYWTILPSAILIAMFCFVVKIYMYGAQDVRRLEGTTKSPVFNMITSTLNGIATIRSAGAEKKLRDEFDLCQDLHTVTSNCYLAGLSTLGLYLDIMSMFYVTCNVFIFLFIDQELISVGNAGLAITQGYMLTVYLQHGARVLVAFIAQLTSVERVLEYTRIETEPNLFEGKSKPPPDWPSAGDIEFRGVYLRYDAAQLPVLKDLSFHIRSGWKVGIVGRTGAGKSSLISALFRFAYIDGTISIDGLDTGLISRQELRSNISIISQEPVLFPATIRYNLDPFNLYSDEDLWRALEQVKLKSAIHSLDFKVTEGGSNLSVGQRQLMCLARAVLRSNKILIMDEATANVDPLTDHFIQQTIRRLFASCTVLTIAHRLNTVMDSDRLLVMAAGQLVEFDHPHLLLSDPNSTLSFMVRETGDKISSQLHSIAELHYEKHNLIKKRQ